MRYLRIILGLILGLLIGAVVNGSIIHLGTMLFPYPKGVDVTTKEGMNAFRELPVQFYIFPFFSSCYWYLKRMSNGTTLSKRQVPMGHLRDCLPVLCGWRSCRGHDQRARMV